MRSGRYSNYKEQNILVAGPRGSGKSALILRAADSTFTESHISTLGVEFKVRSVEVENEVIKTKLYDLSHVPRHENRKDTRGMDTVLLLVDVTDTESLKLVEKIHLKYLQENSEIKFIIVGSKIDLASERKISSQMLHDFAANLQIQVFETSAKYATNVEKVIFAAATDYKKRMKPELAVAPSDPTNKEYKRIAKVWDESRASEMDRAIALLKDYTKGNGFMRFLTFHWKRNHADAVSKIIEKSQNRDINWLKEKLSHIRLENPDGTLAQSIDVINDRTGDQANIYQKKVKL